MRFVRIFALFAAFAGTFYFLYHYNHPSERTGIPALPLEENPELRRAWEKRLLADPATGEIPPGIFLREQAFARSLPKAASDRSAPQWVSRGPWNVGGRTRALAMDVRNENRLLAGGVAGGIWLSEDGGQSWERRTPANAYPGCVSIAQDVRPGKTNVWYYLSGELYGNSAGAPGAYYLGDGLFKSTDNGLTWNPIASTASGIPSSFNSFFQAGWRVVTNPAADTAQEEVYMATIGAIYRSTNGGQSWLAVRGGNLSNYSYATDVTVTPKGVIYATLSSDGPQKGIWRSTNGTTWTDITPANFPATYNRIVIGVNPDDENEVWFLGETPGFGFKSFFISDNNWSSLWRYRYLGGTGAGGGGAWEDRSANLPSKGTQFDRFACQGGYDLVVKVQPGTGHVFIGGTSLYRSTDAFATPDNTTQIGGYKIGTDLPFFELYPNHHPDLHEVLFLPSNPKVLLSASDGGLHRTEDANASFVTWETLNRGYLTSQFYTAMIEHTIPGDNTIIGGLQDNGNFFVNSTDPTKTWVQTVNGDGAFGAILDGKKGYVLSIQQGRVVKCDIDDQGTVRQFQRFDPIGPKKTDYDFINALALDPSDQNIVYLPAGRRFYRQDRLSDIPLEGKWDSISFGWTQYPDTTPTLISAIGVSHRNPSHRVYLGTSNNRLYRIDDAHVGTPRMVTLPRPLTAANNVNCIAVDPDNADRVILVYSNYSTYSIYASENAGQNWRKVGGNLEAAFGGGGDGPSVRWVSILPLPGGKRKYFAGTSVGLFSTDTLITHTSTAQGTRWVQEGADVIGSSIVNYIETRPVDGLVVAATHSIGMFSANFDVSVGSKEPATTNTFAKIYPNPVTDRFTVELPQKDGTPPASFRLFDAKGLLVRRQNLSNALNTVDAADLPPGTYFYEVIQGAQKQTGKLMRSPK